MTAHIQVSNISKIFSIALSGNHSVTLGEALRLGRREVRHREIRALDDISFEVREGERVGVIGSNGAGKTTLLSLIAGINEPTSGRIEVRGDLHAMLTIGTVLREDATGRENVYLDGAVHGKSRSEIDQQIEDIIAFADLGEFFDRPVRTYSSGMKARLAFAMGAFIDPDVLIIDETLSVGDAFFAEKATRRMKEIAARGRIVILVSHSLGSIVEMCNRCIWLDQGRIVMDGPPDIVTSAYQRTVEQSDEASLAAKFEAGETLPRQLDRAVIAALELRQNGRDVTGTVQAFEPFVASVAGTILEPSADVDVVLRIVRVDGRLLWEDQLSRHTADPPQRGSFTLEIAFDPLLLGVNLYRFDALITSLGRPIDIASRVFEVVDVQGQYGGKPLLFYPPHFMCKAIENA
jgi:lipopolysaccharide transport system ATP-binding protein